MSWAVVAPDGTLMLDCGLALATSAGLGAGETGSGTAAACCCAGAIGVAAACCDVLVLCASAFMRTEAPSEIGASLAADFTGFSIAADLVTGAGAGAGVLTGATGAAISGTVLSAAGVVMAGGPIGGGVLGKLAVCCIGAGFAA